MPTMYNPIPKDSTCPKCGKPMHIEKGAYGLPLYQESGVSDQKIPLVMSRCSGCNYVELYLPKM
jgi:ssDNA-binding Zn-finger/Zn-ribbon topoisomerase 1